jgi:hypothetical protein
MRAERNVNKNNKNKNLVGREVAWTDMSDLGRTFGGIMRLIIDVPALGSLKLDQRVFHGEKSRDKFGRLDVTHPLAESRLLISFLIFHVWIFCSASVAILRR